MERNKNNNQGRSNNREQGKKTISHLKCLQMWDISGN